MPQPLVTYRIFIASPGGLAPERQTFRDVVRSYNDTDAVPRGAQFVPVGWEDTLPGRGRPQAVINRDLEQCDYCIVVLWDRWGTAPDERGTYTSGTEEEFSLAMRLAESPLHALNDVVLLFKQVDSRQLSDPGPELRRVLEFRKRIERERQILFDTFADEETFEEKLRRLLAHWLRLHDKQPSRPEKMAAPLPASAPPPLSATAPAKSLDTPEIGRARALADSGRLTEADEIWAQVITAANDALTWRTYAEFLIDFRRFREAEAPIQRALALDQLAEDERQIAEDLLLLGTQRRLVKRCDDAEATLRDAANRFLRLRIDSGVARALLEQARTRLLMGDVKTGVELCKAAEEKARVAGDSFLKAEVALAMAGAVLALDRKEEAEFRYTALLEQQLTPLQRGRTLYALAIMRRAAGAVDAAEDYARATLQIADGLPNLVFRADARIVLGMILFDKGDAIQAASLAQQAIALARDSEFVATSFQQNIRVLIGKLATSLPDAARNLTDMVDRSAWLVAGKPAPK
jgi:tetratricopeptide (TPR) repeat protein